MKRKHKRVPITEENLREAVSKIFDDMFIGEIMKGVYMAKVPGTPPIMMGKEGWKLLSEEIKKEVIKIEKEENE